VANASKRRKKPPPARIWTRGRWWWWQPGCNRRQWRVKEEGKKENGQLHLSLPVFAALLGPFASKRRNQPPPARVWTRGRWWWREACRNAEKNHLQLAFGREGGGGGGSRVETTKSTTSGSRLDAREVVVVVVASKCRKAPPPARVWTRGRWWWQGFGCRHGFAVSFCPGGEVSNSMFVVARFFATHLLPPCFYPPLGTRSRVFEMGPHPS